MRKLTSNQRKSASKKYEDLPGWPTETSEQRADRLKRLRAFRQAQKELMDAQKLSGRRALTAREFRRVQSQYEKAFYAAESPEERARRNTRVRLMRQARGSKMTPEEQKAYNREKHNKWLENEPPEKRAARKARISAAKKERIKNETDEQRQARLAATRERNRKRIRRMSAEEKRASLARAMERRRARFERDVEKRIQKNKVDREWASRTRAKKATAKEKAEKKTRSARKITATAAERKVA